MRCCSKVARRRRSGGFGAAYLVAVRARGGGTTAGAKLDLTYLI